MSDNTTIRLTVPRQDLAESTLFHATPEAVQSWLETIPVANTGALAESLNQAISDINRLKLTPESRFQMLECLRPDLDTALASLYKKYLNQPLVMPTEPANMAALAEWLLTAAATAYTVVAVEAIQKRDSVRDVNPARLTCEAIQRALVYSGRRVLQAFQLYRPLKMTGWQSLHQLYALAEDQQLTELAINDYGAGAHTIRATYLQSLLLSCCKPNQLTQIDLDRAHEAMRSLAEMAELYSSDERSSLFVVDLASDQPPLYSSLLPDSPEPSHRFIDTAVLIGRLKEIKEREQSEVTPLDAAGNLPTYLIDHMIESLGSMSLRNFSRTPTDSSLRVCLGLSSTHYHVAGHQDFEQVLHGSAVEHQLSTGNPFLKTHHHGDMWQEVHPETDYVRNEWLPGQQAVEDTERQIDLDEATRAELLEEVEVDLPLDERYPIYKVALNDASPGGYCLEWIEELPPEIRAGDIVSIMEEHGEHWALAVIRWLNRVESSRTMIGLELLSPSAEAFGAMIHQKDGKKGAPMRVLLLPEIKLVGQPQTLITPRASFRERQRLTLVSQGRAYTVDLTRQIAATASYSQFEFKYIEELGDVLSKEGLADINSPYDSLWSNI